MRKSLYRVEGKKSNRDRHEKKQQESKKTMRRIEGVNVTLCSRVDCCEGASSS